MSATGLSSAHAWVSHEIRVVSYTMRRSARHAEIARRQMQETLR